jgi:MFS family permease
MSARDRALWVLAILLAIALLIAPALWHGFALLQYDTGGYLARWYEGYLVPSRAVVYGLILLAGVPLAFWPVLALQAALTVWVIALVLRAHGLGNRPWLLLTVIAALTVVTTLPWLTSILLTDIFCGLSVLALYLVVMRAGTLSRREHIGLVVLTAVSAATHSATLAVLLALMMAAALLCIVDRKRMPVARIGHGLLALALGAVLVFAANAVVAKQLAWTPGGFALSFGRMLQDGIVKKYLDQHCPAPELKLCAYKDRLPDNADVWFWGSPLFNSLGRFAGLAPEMEKIVVQSLIEYPGLQAKTAAIATAKQLIEVHTGEGVINAVWHTYGVIERYTPQLARAMHAAHQQRGDIGFTIINSVHYPIALLSMALLPLIMWFARRKILPAKLGQLAAAVSLALVANAFVCGALSNPHDRYGARIVWLAVFAVVLAIARTATPRLGKPAI